MGNMKIIFSWRFYLIDNSLIYDHIKQWHGQDLYYNANQRIAPRAALWGFGE